MFHFFKFLQKALKPLSSLHSSTKNLQLHSFQPLPLCFHEKILSGSTTTLSHQILGYFSGNCSKLVNFSLFSSIGQLILLFLLSHCGSGKNKKKFIIITHANTENKSLHMNDYIISTPS